MIALLLLALAALAPAALADAVPKPETLEGFEQERDEVISRSGKRLWVVWSATDALTFYAPDRQRPVLSACPTGLMTEYVIQEVGPESARGGRWVKLSQGDYNTPARFEPARECGWALTDQLLLHNKPAQDRVSAIPRKVITLFDWRTMHELDDGQRSAEEVSREFFEKTRLYTRPVRDPAHQRGELNMAEFAFVYKTITDADGQRWYLVSGETAMSDEDTDPDSRGWGWIPAMSVVPWDTREAAWPDAGRRRPAHIYRSQPDLIRSLRGGAAPQVEDAAFPRHPRVERPSQMSGPLPLANQGTDMALCEAAGVECAQVVFVGALVTDDAVVRDPDALEDTQARLRLRHDAALEASSHINVVFVLDATASMERYIARAREVPAAVAAELRRLGSQGAISPGMEVRFGAVVYRDDYAGGRRVEKVNLSADLDAVSGALSRVRTSTADLTADPDLPEALFCGLGEAAGLLRSGGAERQQNLLVVLGDQPSATGRACATSDAAAAGQALGASTVSGIFSYALNTASSDTAGFLRDVRTVAGGALVKGGAFQEARFHNTDADARRMAAGVARSVLDLSRLGDRVRAFTEETSGGHGQSPERLAEITALEQQTGYRMSEVVREITLRRLTEDYGFSEAEAGRYWDIGLHNHATIHLPGWVLLTAPDRERVHRTVVLYDEESLIEYKNSLEIFEDEGDEVALMSTWVETCRDVINPGFSDRGRGLVSAEQRVACDRFREGVTRLEEFGIFKMSSQEISALFDDDLAGPRAAEAGAQLAALMDDLDDVRRTIESYTNNEDHKFWFRLGSQDHIWLLSEELLSPEAR
jgi:hypothetical protein